MNDPDSVAAGTARVRRRTRRLVIVGGGALALAGVAVAVALTTGGSAQRSGALTASALKAGDVVPVASGTLTITSGAMQGDTFAGAGSLQAAGLSSEPVAVQYTDSGTWTLTASNGGPGSVRFGDAVISRKPSLPRYQGDVAPLGRRVQHGARLQGSERRAGSLMHPLERHDAVRGAGDVRLDARCLF